MSCLRLYTLSWWIYFQLLKSHNLKVIIPIPIPIHNPNQTLKTNFSKTPRQKLKVKLFSDRAKLTLQESIFTFSFYRLVCEKFVFKYRFRTLIKLWRLISQKFIDRNYKWIYVLIEQASLNQNIILFLISIEEFLRYWSSKFD